jgi:hypothetical protein
MNPVRFKQLVVRFRGWSTIRLPTDPDPADEPRGASGYTFAFAGEPDLDRVLRFQPEDEPALLRSGAPWPWGVFVYDAFLTDRNEGRRHDVGELVGASLRLHGQPMFENRAWLLTPPGYEPIFPFDLSADSADGTQLLRRSAPLDPDDPKRPLLNQSRSALLAQGAKGMWIERETVGSATGIWDAIPLLERRASHVESRLAVEEQTENKDDARVRRIQCLRSRLAQLRYALRFPTDRRVLAHYGVERFGFPMKGKDAVVRVPSAASATGPVDLLRLLDSQAPWFVDFWLGAWDFDLFAAYCQGSLIIPCKAEES